MLDSPLLQETRQFSQLLLDTLIKDQQEATGEASWGQDLA